MYIYYSSPRHLKNFRKGEITSNLYTYLDWVLKSFTLKATVQTDIHNIKIDYFSMLRYPENAIPYRFYCNNPALDLHFAKYPIIILWNQKICQN